MPKQTNAAIVITRCDLVGGSPSAPTVVVPAVYNNPNWWEVAAPWGNVFSPDPVFGVEQLVRKNVYSMRQWLDTGTRPGLPSGGSEL
jgi:hypothetical protein